MENIVVGAGLLFNTISDIREKEVSIISIIVMVVLGLFFVDFRLDNIVGAVLGIVIILISMLYKGVGTGDGLTIAGIGTVLGFSMCIEILLLASICACVCGVGLLITKKGTLKKTMPFIPFVMIGFMLGGLL